MTDNIDQAHGFDGQPQGERSFADVFWPDDANTAKAVNPSQTRMTGEPFDDGLMQHDETGFEPFALPEGIDIDYDTLSAFRPIAADIGLDQIQAQALVDFYAAQIDGVSGRIDDVTGQGLETIVEQNRTEWVQAAREDKEIGGVRHQQAVNVAQGALRSLGTPELVSVLAETGLGDHPEVIRLFYRIGTKIGEDPLMTGGGGHAPSSLADLFYGSNT